MSTIGRISGADIRVYPNDHPPPHVHVFHQGEEVRLKIFDAVPLDDTSKFPVRVLRDAQDWLMTNQLIAANKWSEYHDEP